MFATLIIDSLTLDWPGKLRNHVKKKMHVYRTIKKDLESVVITRHKSLNKIMHSLDLNETMDALGL